MNQENPVRIHLKQAILVGHGKEARYAKVLVGEQEALLDEGYPNQTIVVATVIGYVWGYKGFNLEAPTRMRLAHSNILAIEDAKVEPARCERRRCHRVTVMAGTPETLWARPGPRQVSLFDVDRAQRIIQLRKDGTYRVVKDMSAEFADAYCAPCHTGRPHSHTLLLRNEVIFLYDEEPGE